MVLPQLNAIVAMRPVQAFIGFLVVLMGLHHILAPADSVVAWLLGLMKIGGSGINVIAVLVGVLVVTAGLGKIGMVLEEMGVY